MKQTIFDKRIPTIFGIFVIFIGIIATSFFTQKRIPFISKASTAETPQNIRISNISPTLFTLSFTTPGSVFGSVIYGPNDKMENTATDNSDENKNVAPKTLHVITIKNLIPQTQYFFSIVSGETTFLDNGKPFAITTAPNIANSSKESRHIKGTILFSDNAPQEAIIYIATKDSQTLSTIIDKNSNYDIPLQNIRDKTLNNYASIIPDDKITMLVVGENTKSNITFLASQANPVPPVLLSKTYDFTINTIPIASEAASVIVGFPDLQASPSAIKTPQINTPKKNEALTDLKPLFKGIASPSANVIIEIHSDEQIKTEIVADKNGTWTFRPKTPLTPGDHTVILTTRDQYGILKTITQSFTVYAQGSQVGQSATPSATLTPSITGTPKISSTPASIATSATPTIAPTLTPTPTPKPTIIPVPTKIYPPIESPGNSSLFGLTATVLSVIILGLMLLYFLRRKYIQL